MAKDKPAKGAKPTAGDRHKSTFVIRVPEVFRDAVELLAESNDRPVTSEVQRALRAHLQQHMPPDHPALLAILGQRPQLDGGSK